MPENSKSDCAFCGNGPQLRMALAACRSIRFAVANSKRYHGEFSLNDIESADRLAREALRLGKPARKKS